MKPTRLCIAALAALLAGAPAAQAARATVRVMTAQREIIGPAPELSGAATAYVDDTGTAQKLPPDTVMGQLFAVAAVHDLAVSVHVGSQGGYVNSIGGVVPGMNGFWELFVNDVSSATGADATTIHNGDSVVWVLDPDYTQPGPAFLDLKLVSRRHGRARLHVIRADEKGQAAAVGASVHVRGKWYPVDAGGNVTIKAHGSWNARARLAGAISSERLTVRT
jgi:hypothetical protein